MQNDVRNALEQRKREYWAKNLRMTAALMVIGFVVTFVVAFFARDLNFKFFGWPFSFWMAAQGALVIYVALVCFYARYMNRLDRDYGFEESNDSGTANAVGAGVDVPPVQATLRARP